MTLPEKDPKGYLKIDDSGGGRALIVGESQHIEELEALLRQRGIYCAHVLGGAGREALELHPDADRAAAQEVLDSYKAAKGS